MSHGRPQTAAQCYTNVTQQAANGRLELHECLTVGCKRTLCVTQTSHNRLRPDTQIKKWGTKARTVDGIGSIILRGKVGKVMLDVHLEVELVVYWNHSAAIV